MRLQNNIARFRVGALASAPVEQSANAAQG